MSSRPLAVNRHRRVLAAARPDARVAARVNEHTHARSAIAEALEDETFDWNALEWADVRSLYDCGCVRCLVPVPERIGAVREHVLWTRWAAWLGFRQPVLPPETAAIGLAPVAARHPDDLIRALEDHLRLLSHGTEADVESAPSIRSVAFGSAASIEACRALAQRWDARSSSAVRVLLFAPFWIRPLGSWRPDGGSSADDADVRSLVRHLFVEREVPEWAYSCWTDDAPSLKWLCQFVLLAQGGSLRRAARSFGWYMPKRFPHALSQVRGATSWGSATRSAMIACLGGDDAVTRRIDAQKELALDPTVTVSADYLAEVDRCADRERDLFTPGGNPDLRMRQAFTFAAALLPDEDVDRDRDARASDLAFWFDVVRWIVRYRARLDEDRIAGILDWAIHRHIEAQLGRADAVAWARLTPRAAIDEAETYARGIALGWKTWQVITWQPQGWSLVLEDRQERWELVELTSSTALAEEGEAMHHCVVTYTQACAAGRRAIFSLRRGGQRRATIEVDVTIKRVIQARGACNAKLPAREQEIVLAWIARFLDWSNPVYW